MGANFTPNLLGYSGVEPFKYWCQTTLPLVYDDSLSYYELLNKIMYYVNKTITDVANCETNITSLKNAYEELQDYVNNYFSSTDFEQFVDNRLDEMAINGTLSRLIAELYSEINLATVVNSVSDMTDKEAVYLLSSNMHMYYYNTDSDAWVDSGVVYGGANAIKSSNMYIRSVTSGTPLITDANDIMDNGIYYIHNSIINDSENPLVYVANLPAYGRYGVLTNYNAKDSGAWGRIQTYYCEKPNTSQTSDNSYYAYYFRFYGQMGTDWSRWIEVGTENALKGTNTTVSHTNVVYSDADDVPNNSTIVFANNITESDVANLPYYGDVSTLITITPYNYMQFGCIQLFNTYAHGYYIRYKNSSSFNSWQRIDNFDMGDAVAATNVIINHANSSSYNDADNFAINTIYFINNDVVSTDISHLPAYSVRATIMTFSYNTNQAVSIGRVQMYFSYGKGMYYRVYAASLWSDWRAVLEDNTFDYARYLKASNMNVLTDVNNASFSGNDLNNYTENNIYYMQASTAPNADTIPDATPFIHLPNVDDRKPYVNPSNIGSVLSGVFVIQNYNTNNVLGVNQLIFDSLRGRCWFRNSYGSTNNIKWSEWNEIFTNVSINNTKTCKIFNKVVCCGDSLTSGHINIDGTAHQINEDFSWVHYMQNSTANEYVNCGKSGANVRTWAYDETTNPDNPNRHRGLTKAQNSGVSPCYLIALGVNDAGTTNGVRLTNTEPVIESGWTEQQIENAYSDIGVDEIEEVYNDYINNNLPDIDADYDPSYYEGMTRICIELLKISESAHIFIMTIPRDNTDSIYYSRYNRAIKDVVNTLNPLLYNVAEKQIHIIDLYQYKYLYNMYSFVSDLHHNHYTAIGYEQMAEVLMYVWSRKLDENTSLYTDVYSLPTTTYGLFNEVIAMRGSTGGNGMYLNSVASIAYNGQNIPVYNGNITE